MPIFSVWANDQPSESTGSASVQTMREPSGPSRRACRPFRVSERGKTSLYTGEVFISSSVKREADRFSFGQRLINASARSSTAWKMRNIRAPIPEALAAKRRRFDLPGIPSRTTSRSSRQASSAINPEVAGTNGMSRAALCIGPVEARTIPVQPGFGIHDADGRPFPRRPKSLYIRCKGASRTLTLRLDLAEIISATSVSRGTPRAVDRAGFHRATALSPAGEQACSRCCTASKRAEILARHVGASPPPCARPAR